jgi:hypothetical protein
MRLLARLPAAAAYAPASLDVNFIGRGGIRQSLAKVAKRLRQSLIVATSVTTN